MARTQAPSLSHDEVTPGARWVTVLYPFTGQFAGPAPSNQFHVSVIDVRVEDDTKRIAGWSECQHFTSLLEKAYRPEVSSVLASVNNAGRRTIPGFEPEGAR
jgi:hypothetical protein